MQLFFCLAIFKRLRWFIAVDGPEMTQRKVSQTKNSTMVPILTEKDFSTHLNSKFYLELTDGSLELVLAEVQRYPASPTDQSGMERFSIFFDGPGIYLPQNLYHLKHDQMGELDIFLVPVSGDQRGYHYEAVFNSFK